VALKGCQGIPIIKIISKAIYIGISHEKYKADLEEREKKLSCVWCG